MEGKKRTAGDLKCPDTVNKLIRLDEGFRVWRMYVVHQATLSVVKRIFFAMIRQLGNLTWFCSFSAAETRWNHLLKMLGRLVDHREYSDCEIYEMTWQKKSELIQNDPVTYERNFDYMIQRLIHDVLKSEVMHACWRDCRFFLQSWISAKRKSSYSCVNVDKKCSTVWSR